MVAFSPFHIFNFVLLSCHVVTFGKVLVCLLNHSLLHVMTSFTIGFPSPPSWTWWSKFVRWRVCLLVYPRWRQSFLQIKWFLRLRFVCLTNACPLLKTLCLLVHEWAYPSVIGEHLFHVLCFPVTAGCHDNIWPVGFDTAKLWSMLTYMSKKWVSICIHSMSRYHSPY